MNPVRYSFPYNILYVKLILRDNEKIKKARVCQPLFYRDASMSI